MQLMQMAAAWRAAFMPADSRAPAQGVCHRDLKLENTLLDGRTAPRLKICDFGYSKVREQGQLLQLPLSEYVHSLP